MSPAWVPGAREAPIAQDEGSRLLLLAKPGPSVPRRLEHQVLAESRFVAVSGRVERMRWHRSLLGRLVRPLPLSEDQATATRPERPDVGGEQEAAPSIPA